MFEIQGDIKVLDPQKQGEAYPESEEKAGDKLFFLESYGCQMNFSDSEIVASILKKEGFDPTTRVEEADLILLNTCSIREKAEQTVRNRLKQFSKLKKQKPEILIGMLGCMAERLKEKLLDEEKLVDIVVGPDAYRDLPKLVQKASGGQKAVNTLLSLEETYADISPVRLDSNGVTAFVSIMRGCDNMCSFCVVPFTRGRERSRDPESLLQEARELVSKGYREITLLGQNVDSYLWFGGGPKKDFKKLSKIEQDKSLNFAGLLEKMALVDPGLRIRFSTSHPKDITEEVVYTMARHENICNYIHLPLQAGSSKVLKNMNRTYNREEYIQKVYMIRSIIPDCGLSADIISGFCGETEEDHLETLEVMEEVKYDFAYTFMYSERPGTLAQKKFKDDVPEETKKRRLSEIIELQRKHSEERNKADLGKVHKVLVEKTSKRSESDMCGRNDQNKMVIFPDLRGNIRPGQYLDVRVNECTSATLLGSVLN